MNGHDGIDGRKIGRMIGGWEKHTMSEREMMENGMQFLQRKAIGIWFSSN